MKFIPSGPAEYSLREKRSEFIAVLVPVTDIAEFQAFQRRLRGKHPNARHICWGRILEQSGMTTEASSDGGEPSGSAGRPILNQLKSAAVVNAAVFVIRYFGGVKLGKRGLTDAYRRATQEVLNRAKLLPWVSRTTVIVSGPLEFYGDINRISGKFGGKMIADHSAETVMMEIEFSLERGKEFSRELRARFGKDLRVKIEERARAKPRRVSR
jgi:uncharacterized YigZ family protein